MSFKQSLIKDLPEPNRPRERLIRYGSEQLSNKELMAILIGSGIKNESVMDISNRIFHNFTNLKMLNEATFEELINVRGIGRAKAVKILAALELGRRICRYTPEEKRLIRSPEDGANYVMEEMRNLHQEHFVILLLDIKNYVIQKKTIFIGSLFTSVVHPREIFREAIKHSAASLICVHNHPSGDPLYRV